MFRGREGPEGTNDRRSSGPIEGKGNVIVSVRVRPDAGNHGDHNRSDGEWLVDGRRSLIAYRGKDAGDHYYGKLYFRPAQSLAMLTL